MIQQATPNVDENAKAGNSRGGAEAVAENTPAVNRRADTMTGSAADNPFAKAKAEYPGTTWRLEGEFIRITIPIKFKRRGGRKQIILPDGTTVTPASDSRRAGHTRADKSRPPTPQPAAQSAIVTALARAFKWQEMLGSGEVESIAALAKRLRLEASYIRRILRLTCLAPDIIEALVDGKEPDGLSLRKLLQYGRFCGPSSGRNWGSPQSSVLDSPAATRRAVCLRQEAVAGKPPALIISLRSQDELWLAGNRRSGTLVYDDGYGCSVLWLAGDRRSGTLAR